MRILVSFDDTHRSYRILIARALRSLPNGAAKGEANGAEDPIASARSVGTGAWVMAPVDTSRPAEICLDGEAWSTHGPPLSEVLEIIDETEARLHEGRLVGGC